MQHTPRSRNRTNRCLAAAIACAGTLALAACGDGGSNAASDLVSEIGEQSAAESTPDAPDGEAPAVGTAEILPPTFLLTSDVAPAAGWIEVLSTCAETEYPGPPYFTYHIPADWRRSGSGYGGSGGVDGFGDRTYELPDGTCLRNRGGHRQLSQRRTGRE